MNAHEKIIHALKLENEELRRRLQQYESAGKQALVDEPVIGQKKIGLDILLDHIPAMIFLKDIESRYIAATENFCRYLGSTREEIAGKTDYDFYEKGLADLYKESDLLAIRSGDYIDFGEEEIIEGAQKKTYSSKKVLVRDQEGNPVGILGIAFDITRQKEIEKELVRSEERYKAFISQTNEGIYRMEMKVPVSIDLPYDEQIRLIYENAYIAECNDALAEMYGMKKAEQLTGKMLLEFHGSNDNEINVKAFRHMFANNYKVLDEETLEYDQSGNEMNILNNSAGIIVNRHLTNIWGTQTNITEKKKAEQALRDSEKRYKELYSLFRLMADNMPDLVWAKDMNRNFTFTNRAICEKLLNTSDVNEPIGKNEMYFVNRERLRHQEIPDWFNFGEYCGDSDNMVMSSGQVGRFDEYGNVMGKYLFLDVQKAPIIDENGNMIGTVGSARDETEKRKIEGKLNELLSKYKAMLNAIPDLMFLYDKEGFFLDVHAHDPNELLAPADEIIGHHISDFFPEEQSREILELIQLVLAGEKTMSYEYEVQLPDGINYYESRHVPVNENEVLSISRNITQRKKMEMELRLAKDTAEASNRLKTALLMNMSHELRTPMNGIIGFAELMKDAAKESEIKDMSVNILKSGNRLMDTLDAIMELSQLESGIKQPDLEKVQVNRVLTSLLNEYDELAASKSLNFTIEPAKNHYITADPKLLRKAIVHLLDNAFKFTLAGYIKISQSILVSNSNKYLLIKIKDTGIGIAEEYQKTIFDEFSQISQGYSRSHEGVGIGLSLARKITHIFNGTIHLESKINEGSVFTLTFPLSETEQDVNKDFQTRPGVDKTSHMVKLTRESHASKIKILIAEDDIVNLNLLVAALHGNYDIDVANSPFTAIEKINLQHFDVVILDFSNVQKLENQMLIRSIFTNNPERPTLVITTCEILTASETEKMKPAINIIQVSRPFKKPELLNTITNIFKSNL